MRHYETIFILKPTLAEDEYKETLEKYSDLIEKSKGILIKTEEWGKQDLAYLVKKFDKGFFILLNYCGEPGITDRLERDMKIDERVIRFQTVKLADKADPDKLKREAESAVPPEEEPGGEEGVSEKAEASPEQGGSATGEVSDGVQ
ncbi:MAG: 30S ribosomal protein S6 [Deltaproteobacteria bacterium]|nr:30S ribosomal protein S6 [Deltaproteobacteria bacterium]